jgi:hypothetical protein
MASITQSRLQAVFQARAASLSEEYDTSLNRATRRLEDEGLTNGDGYDAISLTSSSSPSPPPASNLFASSGLAALSRAAVRHSQSSYEDEGSGPAEDAEEGGISAADADGDDEDDEVFKRPVSSTQADTFGNSGGLSQMTAIGLLLSASNSQQQYSTPPARSVSPQPVKTESAPSRTSGWQESSAADAKEMFTAVAVDNSEAHDSGSYTESADSDNGGGGEGSDERVAAAAAAAMLPIRLQKPVEPAFAGMVAASFAAASATVV